MKNHSPRRLLVIDCQKNTVSKYVDEVLAHKVEMSMDEDTTIQGIKDALEEYRKVE